MTVKVTMPVVAILASVVLPGWSNQVRAEPALTLSVHLVIPCDAITDRVSAPMRMPGSQKEYCLERSPMISHTDIVSGAFVTKASAPFTIKLALNDEAATGFRLLTRQNIGNPIGIVLDGRLHSVATLQSSMESVWMFGRSREEAERVIHAFAGGLADKRSAPALPAGNGQRNVRPYDSPPALIKKKEPEYTERARAARIEGTVVLAVVIQPDGTPDELGVVRSLAPDLDAQAIECVRSWRFRPALKDGKPVPLKATVQVDFKLPPQ